MAIDQNQSLISQIVQAPLAQLLELRYRDSELSEVESFYLDVLIFYLKGEVSNLKTVITNESFGVISELAKMRLSTLECRVDETDVDQLLKKFIGSSYGNNEIWLGECYFVLAQALATGENNNKASNFYKKSYTLLNSNKVLEKSLKALTNHLVIESRIDPEKTLASDYYFIAKKQL